MEPSPTLKAWKGLDDKYLISINSTFLLGTPPPEKSSIHSTAIQLVVSSDPSFEPQLGSLSCKAGGPEDLAWCLLSDGIFIALLPQVTNTSSSCFSQNTEGL